MDEAKNQRDLTAPKFSLLGLFLAVLTAILFSGCQTTERDVTREVHDEELQSFYPIGRMVASWSSTERGVRRLQSWIFKPMEGDIIDGVHNQELYIKSSTGDHQIRVRIFKPEDTMERLPAMLYIHGGGYVMGVPEQSNPFFKELLNRRDLVIVAPAYRLAPENPYPAGFNDTYDTLLWMRDNADDLGIYPSKFIIAGHSAGGGMTAAITLKARDTQDVKIAFQMPIYPMIDYRQNTASAMNMNGALYWDTESNAYGWDRYLAGLEGFKVPVYASPALNDDYHGFPPTISFVGTVEPFFDETVAYMKALDAAGIPIKFRVFQGAFHGFEGLAPDTAIAQSAIEFQYHSFEEFFDLYAR